MAMKLIEFNRRGFICAFNRKMTPGEKEALTGEERVIFRAIEKLDAKYFVVMKRISEKYMLVAPVFSSRRKDCKKIRINNKEFWVNFMTFYMVPEKIFEAVPGKYLDFSYRTITDIYTSHNNVLKEKWRRENEQRILNQELRRMARARKRNERHYNMEHLYPVPKYLQQAAARPLRGGTMSAR